MAEADPIRRIKAAARRAGEPPSVEMQQRWYRETLEQDLAPSTDALNQRLKNARRGRRLGVLGWTVVFLFIISVTMVGIFIRQLWRDGALAHVLDRPFARKIDDSGWMVGKERGGPQAGEAPPDARTANEILPSLVEPIPAPAAAASNSAEPSKSAENDDPTEQ